MENLDVLTNEQMAELTAQARGAMEALLEAANLRAGQIVVVGCSTSEVMGRRIGQGSSQQAAEALMAGLLPPVRERGLFLAVQCCEHLNRALVVERACAERYDLPEVNVHPALHAGGALSVQATKAFDDYVMVEAIRAHAGMDIGDTLIGMHLRPVVVPVRSERAKIGRANVVLARTRAKYIGGPRAQYDTDAR